MIGLISATAAGAAARDRLAAAWPDRTRVYDGPVGDAVRAAFAECERLVCFLATGAVVRLVAPLLDDKRTDPGVVCVDEGGRFAVSLVGGHGGGANELARAVGEVLGAEPVVTTATDNVGQSGATIYRLYGKPDAPELFLKHGKGSVANDVTDEMVRLNWLTEFMPLPTIKHFIRTPDDAWLLTTAIPGKTAFQVLEEYPDSGENIVDALAVFLRRLHSIPVCNCPFNSDRVFRLAQAQSRMNNGLVDASDFDDERNGWPVEQVWKEMHKLLPFSPDSVVTHGDFSLDNLIFDEGKLIGCIDVGRVGIADRYQDLAILWNCLGEFSPSLQKRLFQKYGIDNPDMNKLQFHLMLDEFF